MNTAARHIRRRTLAILIALLAAGSLTLLVQSSLSSAAASNPVTSRSSGPTGEAAGPTGEAGGHIREGHPLTVFDRAPAVARLDPLLREALQRAAKRADRDGVELRVNSGWRSPAFQAELLQDATEKYGSEKEASRWVATPDASEHVTGEAVDIGPWAAADWLGRHGAAFGLCQIYANEAWHFELRTDAADDGCPRMFRDAAERRR